MASNVVLRVGVVRGVAVVDERRVRVDGPISFGTARDNTFVIDAPDIPHSVVLFDVDNETHRLRFDASLSGSVARDARRSETLASLAGTAERVDGVCVVALNAASRGRVQLGSDTTIFFHFVPSDAATSSAPQAKRTGALVGQVEPVFTAVLLASFLVHAALGLVAVVAAPPSAPEIDDLRRVVENIASPRPAAPKIDVKHGSRNAAASATSDKTTPPSHEAIARRRQSSGAASATGGAGAAAMRDAVDDHGILRVIGGHGDGASDDPMRTVFAARSGVGDDVTEALKGTRAVDGARAAADVVTRRSDGECRGCAATDVGELLAVQHADVDTGAKQSAHVVARVHDDEIAALDGGKIDKKDVAAILRRRRDGFQACYEESLKASSQLHGKLVVEFTIGDGGKVNEARVVNDALGSAEVSRCVVTLLKRVRFSAPTGGEVTISNTFVFQPGS